MKRRKLHSCSLSPKTSTDSVSHGGKAQQGLVDKNTLGKQVTLFFLLLIASVGIVRKGSIVDLYIDFFTKNRLIHQVDAKSKQKNTPKQAVVIIASAPGLGYEIVEKDLIDWSKNYKIRPYSYVVPDISPDNYTKSQGCLPLVDAILTKASSVPRGFDGYNLTKNNSSDYLIMEFQKEFNSIWMQNKNILIGSDHLPYFQDEKLRRLVINRLVEMFPWNDKRLSLPGSNRDAKVIVLYRSSRINHLQSYWSSSSANVEFIDWLSSYDVIRHIDIFSTADVFSRNGLKVDVVDVDYVVKKGQNLTAFILCEVIGLSCGSGSLLKDVVGGNFEPTRFHARNGNFNFEFQKLEAAINEFDCKFDFLRSTGVRFFPTSLSQKFSSCRVPNANKEELAVNLYNFAKELKTKTK